MALKEHLGLVFVSMLAAVSAGIVFGIILSRPSLYYLGKAIENVVNVGQTVPRLSAKMLWGNIRKLLLF
ncbi:MAG: hypothetical protein GX996_00540 [Firmicutes bacterium]|nr:hypothetical protein [Bacillota bacterium]